MKTSFRIMTLLVSVITLASCDKGCTGDPDAPSVSAQAQAALLAKYPAASNVRWQTKGGYVVADFSLAGTRVGAQHGGSDLSAWFDNGGEWYMTQTDIPFTMLPEAVRTAFAATEYAAAPWSVDDVDMLEREGVETVYVIEVEKYDNGRETEIDLYYSVDGVLVRKIADAAPDYDYGDYIPSKPVTGIGEYIRTHYPNARITDIDYEKGMTEVDIVDGRTPRELLFDGSGVWQYTKTEVRLNEVPETVIAALRSSDYASYRIDDIDHYRTPEKEFWRFELESARGDVKVDISTDGTLTLKQPGSNAGGSLGQDGGAMVSPDISDFLAAKYPGSTIVECDYDDGLLEVEIWHDGREKDVYFNGRNAWVYTEWDIRRGEIPAAVTTALASSQWAAFEIDDLEYVQTPDLEYYLMELERGDREVELRITPAGMIL